MAAAGQIQLAVVSAAAGDRDSAYGTVISVAPSHCQSAFVLQRLAGKVRVIMANDLANPRLVGEPCPILMGPAPRPRRGLGAELEISSRLQLQRALPDGASAVRLASGPVTRNPPL